MRMNNVINSKIKEFRNMVRTGYKFTLKYPSNKSMEYRIEEEYQYMRGYFNGLMWCTDVTIDDITLAHRKLTYEYFRLKSIYVPNCETLKSLTFLIQVTR